MTEVHKPAGVAEAHESSWQALSESRLVGAGVDLIQAGIGIGEIVVGSAAGPAGIPLIVDGAMRFASNSAAFAMQVGGASVEQADKFEAVFDKVRIDQLAKNAFEEIAKQFLKQEGLAETAGKDVADALVGKESKLKAAANSLEALQKTLEISRDAENIEKEKAEKETTENEKKEMQERQQREQREERDILDSFRDAAESSSDSISVPGYEQRWSTTV